jgi:hypothetical protein
MLVKDAQTDLTKTTPKKRKDHLLMKDMRAEMAETPWHLPKTAGHLPHLTYLPHLQVVLIFWDQMLMQDAKANLA